MNDMDIILLEKLPDFNLNWPQDIKDMWFAAFHHLRVIGGKSNKESLLYRLQCELTKQKEKNSRYRFKIRDMQGQLRRQLK